MRADMFTSDERYKAACKLRSWRPKTKEEIIKNLKVAADSISWDGVCLGFKGLDVFLGQDSIEFRPLTSDRDSLVVSKDSLTDISIIRNHGALIDIMIIRTEYGYTSIALEDRDGQA